MQIKSLYAASRLTGSKLISGGNLQPIFHLKATDSGYFIRLEKQERFSL